MSEHDWAHHLLCFYRLWPVIDRSPRYVDKLSHAIDHAWLVASHGSGDDQIVLNDQDTKSRHQTVLETIVRLRDPDSPPKLVLTELRLHDPANTEYIQQLKREGKINAEGTLVQSNQHPDGSAGTAELARGMVDMAKELVRQPPQPPPENATQLAINKWVLDQFTKERDQGDPSKLAHLLRELKDLLPQPSTEKPADPLAIVRETLALVRELHQPPAAAKSTSPTEHVKEILELVNQVNEMKSGQPPTDLPTGKEPNLTQTIIAAFAPALTQLAQPIGMMLAQRFFKNPGPASTFTPPEQIVNAAVPSTVLPSTMTSGNASVPPSMEASVLAGIMDQVAPLVINAINSGRDGGEFASSIETLFGTLAYEQAAGLGVDGMVSALKTHQSWAILGAVEPQLRLFLQQFVDYGNDNGEPEEPEAPVAKPAKGGKK